MASGSIFALLGSNGAGKTTIVQILTTLLKPDAGTASVNGFDVVSQPARVRESISLTGQFAAVDEILTGRENLIMIAKLRHVTEPAPGRGRPAGAIRPHRCGRPPGVDLLGRHAPPPRHRHEPDRRPAGHLPRRADHRTRPGGPHRGVEGDPRASPTAARRCFLTTQYLEEAEKLADRIAILHEGTIIVSGTLAELRKLLPPAKVEYVERQPTLEEIFLAIVGSDDDRDRGGGTMSTHVVSDMGVMLGRSMRHITRSMDTIITVTIMPIAFMLLFVYVFGGAIQTGTDNYVNYLLPGILLIAIASGISYTASGCSTTCRAASSSGSTPCRSRVRPCCGDTC